MVRNEPPVAGGVQAQVASTKKAALMIGENIVNKILCLLKNQPSIKTIQQLVLKSV